MTVRWTVRAAEPTVAFSPQRKGKTVRFKSHPRNHKKRESPKGGFLYLYGWGLKLKKAQERSKQSGGLFVAKAGSNL